MIRLQSSSPGHLQPANVPARKLRNDRDDASLADKLSQLTEAYNAGLITEVEFQNERKEILDKF